MEEKTRFDLTEAQKTRVVLLNKNKLRRLLGIGALYSVGYGDVGSSIFYALGVTIFWSLGAAPISILIAATFFIFTVLTYSELSSSIPEAGGCSLFARRAFNSDLMSFIAGWALLINYIVTAVISAYTIGPYLSYFFPFLGETEINLIFTSLILIFLTVINIIGIRESTNLNLMMAILAIMTKTIIVLFGFIFIFNIDKIIGQIQIGTAPTWKNFIYGTTIAMVTFTGIEAISQLSGETKKPGSKIPKSMIMTLITVFVFSVSLGFIAVCAVKPEIMKEKWVNNPLLGVVENIPVVGLYLKPWVGILGAVILFIATNAGLIGASRLAYSMGSNFQIPHFFNQLHPKTRTPYISLLIFLVVSILIVWICKRLTMLADLYNFGAMLSFSFAHLSLIGLRIREPHLHRPFKAPIPIKIGNYKIPLTAIIGLCATTTVWIIVVLTHPYGRTLGFIWMALGMVFYFLYRYEHKMPLAHSLKVERISVPEFHFLNVKKILVPTTGGKRTETIQIACEIAKRHNSKITALYVIEVPHGLPIDTFLPKRLASADRALHRAEAIAREYGVEIETQLLQARSARETIVDFAREEKYDLLILGATKEEGPGIKSSPTNEYILRNAPCRVWLCSS